LESLGRQDLAQEFLDLPEENLRDLQAELGEALVQIVHLRAAVHPINPR